MISEMKTVSRTIVYRVCWLIMVPSLLRQHVVATLVEALFHLLEKPLANRNVLAQPLERLALAYLTQARQSGKLYDSVATFHLSNGARLERINAFGNLRPYGLEASYGLTVNYRYLVAELEENHERFVRGEIQVANSLASDYKAIAQVWQASRK